MTGVEIAVGYVFAWLVGKARRVSGRADAEVDRGLDAGMDRLHDLVSRKLGDDPALQRAAEEAQSGQEELSARTHQRLELALEDAAEHDTGFAEALDEAVKKLQAASAQTGGGVSATSDGQAVGGNVEIQAEGGSVAALRTGDVSITNPPKPGPYKG
ncbi:hypothetical protein U9R90_34305 [Streptomyces sp. E11-3]|uniref:hypothetical protein n=1 Tax=Streptomyces sp. E11-3 TaxID=3110112 RepID=UPI00397ED325